MNAVSHYSRHQAESKQEDAVRDGKGFTASVIMIVQILFSFPADFIKAFHKARQEPTKKYEMPQTESQEIGWLSTSLVRKTSLWQSDTQELKNKWLDIEFRLKHRACTEATAS